VVLVDTSIWVDHLRRSEVRLTALLENTEVLTHPFVIGELACGNLARRAQVLGLLGDLPSAPLLQNKEVLSFLETEELQGRGLGWIDMHLLASARLARTPLWCRDKRLAQVAHELSLALPGT
jgi:predicted nucleic acid-binding protein